MPPVHQVEDTIGEYDLFAQDLPSFNPFENVIAGHDLQGDIGFVAHGFGLFEVEVAEDTLGAADIKMKETRPKTRTRIVCDVCTMVA